MKNPGRAAPRDVIRTQMRPRVPSSSQDGTRLQRSVATHEPTRGWRPEPYTEVTHGIGLGNGTRLEVLRGGLEARAPPLLPRSPDTSRRGAGRDRGRDGALICATPPSEPDLRISRIRLSRQQLAPVRRLVISSRSALSSCHPRHRPRRWTSLFDSLSPSLRAACRLSVSLRPAPMPARASSLHIPCRSD